MNASELTAILTGGALALYAMYIIYKTKHTSQ